MNLVVDCSYITSMLLPDEENQPFNFTLYNVFAPAIFFLECSNTLVKSLKRGRVDESNLEESIMDLMQTPVTIDRFSVMPESVRQIIKLSRKYDLTPYDASYLELAIRMDAKLLTLDKALARAAKNSGIEVVI